MSAEAVDGPGTRPGRPGRPRAIPTRLSPVPSVPPPPPALDTDERPTVDIQRRAEPDGEPNATVGAETHPLTVPRPGERPERPVRAPAAPPHPPAPPSAAPQSALAHPEPAAGRHALRADRVVAPTPAQHAAQVVRRTWVELEPRVDEIASWFAALLFSIDPTARALFPAHVGPPARRLIRSLVLPMSTVDRPDELRALLDPLVREHRGLGLTPAQYETLGVALIGALRHFARDGWDGATEHAWVLAFSEAAGPIEEALRRDETPATTTATVIGHQRLSWDLAVITVEPEARVEYRAGQYVSVEHPARPRMWRPLSPACAPRPDGLLEFHVRAVQGGWVSRAMVAHTAPGDVWRVGPPQGHRLRVDPATDRDVLMVAGGTGVAPMLALCDDLARDPDAAPPVTVLLGGRTRDDLYALGRVGALARGHPWLEVGGVCEADPRASGTALGTLSETLVRAGDWRDYEILLAGSPAMIRATASALVLDGVGLDRMHYDPFTD